jgi:hypothetical protein
MMRQHLQWHQGNTTDLHPTASTAKVAC